MSDLTFIAAAFHTNACIHTVTCLLRKKSANVNLAHACSPAMERQVWCSRPSAAVNLGAKAQCVCCLAHMQLRDVRCIVISSSLPLTDVEVKSESYRFLGCCFDLAPSPGPACLIYPPLSWFWSAPSQQLMSYQDPK